MRCLSSVGGRLRLSRLRLTLWRSRIEERDGHGHEGARSILDEIVDEGLELLRHLPWCWPLRLVLRLLLGLMLFLRVLLWLLFPLWVRMPIWVRRRLWHGHLFED